MRPPPQLGRHRPERDPGRGAAFQDKYDFGAGQLTIDLTQVDNVENLDGQNIDIEGGTSDIEVIVPDGWTSR